MRRKRTPQKIEKDALDRAFSLLARQRSGGRCERCGRPANQVHHVEGRTNMRLRWDLRNGYAICGGCHLWAEDKKVSFLVLFAEQRPEDFVFITTPENRAPIHRTLTDLRELRADLEGLLARAAA